MKSAVITCLSALRLPFLAGALLLAGASIARADGVGFHPDGNGSTGAIAQGSAIAGHGFGFVMLQPGPASAAGQPFFETGAWELTAPDGVSPLGAHDITLTYSVVGSVDPASGLATFSGGLIQLYADATFDFGTASAAPQFVFGANDGTAIASFVVTGGSGAAGQGAFLTASAVAGSLASGYFFSASGVDLAAGQPLQLDVAIGNTIDWAPSATVLSEIVCKAADFPGPGCVGGSYANALPYYFVVADQAQAVLSAVPEPGSAVLAWAGLALVGGVVGWRSRGDVPRSSSIGRGGNRPVTPPPAP